MKVLVVAPYPRTREAHGEEGLGGVASYTKNLVDELRKEAQVRILAPTDGGWGARADGDVEIEDVPRAGSRLARRLRKLARAPDAMDVVHVQFEQHLYGGILGFLRLTSAMRRVKRSTRVVATLHQVPDLDGIDQRFLRENAFPPIPFLARAWLRLQVALLSLSAHALIVHEPAFAQRLTRQHGVPSERVRVVPHGVEPARRVLPRGEAKARLGGEGKLVVLYFGFVTGYKGVDLLVDALERLPVEDRAKIQVVVAGKTPERKMDAAGFRARTRALEARIAALAPWTRREGFLSRDEIDVRLAASDLVVFPYRQVFGASGPMSIAVGQGSPVIASEAFRGMGLPDEGLFPLTGDGLAAKLREAIADGDLRRRLASASAARRDGSSWADAARLTRECYQPEPARILLMGAYGQDNLGDEAILEVHLQQLARYPTTVLSSNPEQTRSRYRTESVPTYRDPRRALAAFRRSDALVYGGGSLLKELPAPMFRYRLVANLLVASLAARAAGKRAIYSAMGVERLRTRAGRFLARRAADAGHMMLVRDEGSRGTLRAIGAKGNARVVADPAYLLAEDGDASRWAREYEATLGRPIVVLNPMCSREAGARQHEVADAFAALAREIVGTTDAHVVLLPFKTAGEDADVAVCEEVILRAGSGRVTLAPLDLRPSEALALLRRARFFAGMRHHGVLLALVARTPLVAVPYAEKTTNLAREFGLARHTVDVRDLTPDALVRAYRQAWSERDEIVRSTSAPLRAMERRARENFDALRSFLERGSPG